MKSYDEVIAVVARDAPEIVMATIPDEKRESISAEICNLLTNSGLSFQQAEMLLDVAKNRLRRARI